MNGLPARIEKTTARLLAVCEKRGMALTADDRVSESDAALLLGYTPGSFKNLRSTFGTGPAHYRRPAGAGGRVSYRVEDLAAWIERTREEDPLQLSI